MTVIVQSKTMKVTQALRQAVMRQAQRLTRHSPKVFQVNVFLEKIARKKNDTHATAAEFLVKLPGKDVVVKERAADLYQAIHDAAHAAARQVRKLKEKGGVRPLPS